MSEPVIYILSHNRPANIPTINALKRSNSKLKQYIVIDDTDPQIQQYKRLYDNLVIFNKKEISKLVDTVDNFHIYGTPLYARRYVWEHAKNNGIDCFIMLDDDYHYFCFKYPYNGILKELVIQDIDKLFYKFFELNLPNLYLSFSQNGDYIGGKHNSLITKGFKFKIMNCFFCFTDKMIPFKGTFNDDVNASLNLGLRGDIPLTIGGYSLHQENTQQFDGGMTDIYIEYGTYVKSFQSIIIHPTGVKIHLFTGSRHNEQKHYRIHHKLFKNKIYPKILNEKYKK